MTRFPPGTSGVTIYSQQFSSGNLEFGEPEISEKTKNKMKVRKIVLIKHLIGFNRILRNWTISTDGAFRRPVTYDGRHPSNHPIHL